MSARTFASKFEQGHLQHFASSNFIQPPPKQGFHNFNYTFEVLNNQTQICEHLVN